MNHAACFARRIVAGRRRELSDIYASFADVRVADRSLIWNTDLIETLELENPLAQALATTRRRQPH
jgi:succinate dehydrogenase / fumarate reductase flavoprotein subunit